MKHLAETPPTPSELRPDVPHDLDLVVVRALAKEPADRYQSAAAMDADLETVARGGRVAAETAEAATMVLSGERAIDATAATQVARRPLQPYEPPDRSRSLWPWLVGIGALLALLVAAWFLYEPIKDRFQGADTVAVPYVVGIQQRSRSQDLEDEGLVPQVRRVSNSDVEEGLVFAQDPTEGTRVDEGEIVRIDVSSGKPEVPIPSVVGQTSETPSPSSRGRVSIAQVVEVNSDRDEGTVTAQSPSAGTVVVEGTQVRINVSKGPRPVSVPERRRAAVRPGRGRAPAARASTSPGSTSDSDLAEGIVTRQDPSGGSEGSRGSTVTLSVSKGPTTSAVPT